MGNMPKPKTTVEKTNLAFAVTEEETLLPFLLSHVKGQSRNNIKSLLARRQVMVDGRVFTKFDHPLHSGQGVSILPKVNDTPELPFELLYEDAEIIVINKPYGLLSIATDKEKSKTAYHIVTDYVKAKNPSNRLYIIHRLDRDTSGVLMFAKTEEIKHQLQDKWEEIVKERRYIAVVDGVVHPPEGTIRTWLKETSTHLVYSVPEPGGDAKEAITHYKTLDQSSTHTLLRINLDTGRKNQIRVHMKEMDHPVAGDKKYDSKSNPIGRLALHADRLTFTHPINGKEISFTASPPPAFNKVIRRQNSSGQERT